MFHQDWTQVVIHKPVTRPQTAPQGPRRETKTASYSKELSDAVSQARVAKKLTRDQLAKKCNVLTSLVADLEMRRGPYDAELTNKVLKALDLKVAKRSVPKNNDDEV